ncbi:MAG: hypothetical protein MK066_05495 [Crocinitomicaceae bacterium]|nr:hypothetical protein [Crocinitomicaceae bacterium]
MKRMNTNKWFTLLMLLISPVLAIAQAPPPPPGVPLDFGLSALIAGCVGYGVVKMRGDNKDLEE